MGGVFLPPLAKEMPLYMRWFSEAISAEGVPSIKKQYSFVRRIFSGLPKRIKYILLSCSSHFPKHKFLILPSGGNSCLDDAFPYCFTYHIVPYLWDCWPGCWERIGQMARRLHIRSCFISSSMVAKAMNEQALGTEFQYLPEGICMNLYTKGNQLINREIDVLELGRQHPVIHNKLIAIDGIKHLYNKNGQFVFLSFSSLAKGLSQAKIVICYPRCDTHPEMAGNVETLTQRYWECMLSRCVMVGKCPFELVDLIGYNPVITIQDETQCADLILDILNHISMYQSLVDRNYETALRFGSWSLRAKQFMEQVCQ